MAAASAVCSVALLLLVGEVAAVTLGTIGPLALALGTWVAVARARLRSPGQVSGVMIRLFGVKMVLVPLYVAAVVLATPVGRVPFVVSFTSQLILLYVIEALFLRRLFAGDAREWHAG